MNEFDVIKMEQQAGAIRDLIRLDIEDRSGLGNEWEQLDEEIQDEILREWKRQIVSVLYDFKISLTEPEDIVVLLSQDEVNTLSDMLGTYEEEFGCFPIESLEAQIQQKLDMLWQKEIGER